MVDKIGNGLPNPGLPVGPQANPAQSGPQIRPAVPTRRAADDRAQVNGSSASGATFQEILDERLRSPQGAPVHGGFPGNLGLKFSAHAQARVMMRSIELGQEDMERLSQGVERAAAKGARESLILMDDKAFVVSIVNRTVITAVDEQHLKENVFTNIDSAVIV